MSAVREKNVWILGEGARVAAYVEAVRLFPELELTFRGPHPPVGSELGAPEIAVLCDPVARTPVCVRLLLAGADLLVERPLTGRIDDADALGRLAEAAGRTLQTAGALQLAPGWQRIREHVTARAIGTLRHVGLRLAAASAGEARLPRLAGSSAGEARLPRLAGSSAGEARLPGRRGCASPWGGGGEDGCEGGVRGAEELREWVEALRVLERVAGPLQEVRLGGEGEIETRHAGGIMGTARTGSEKLDPDEPVLVCRGDRGELWMGEAQIVLRSSREVRVLGPGLEPWAGCEEALAELLRRRAGDFVEDDGACQVARALDAALHPGRWRPA